jgi:hypothetical protein
MPIFFLCLSVDHAVWASPEGWHHREGMGQLEHQAMPSLRVEVTHDGWLCTMYIYVLYKSSWKFRQLAAGQLLSG